MFRVPQQQLLLQTAIYRWQQLTTETDTTKLFPICVRRWEMCLEWRAARVEKC
jgi:hypothetical protein